MTIGYAGMNEKLRLAIHTSIAFVILCFAITWLTMLGVGKIPFRPLWVAFFTFGSIFHCASWDGRFGPPSLMGGAFISLTGIHAAIETMLCVHAVVQDRRHVEHACTVIVCFVLCVYVAGSAFQQTTLSTLLFVGGIVAVPADTATLVAGLAVWQRAKTTSVKLFAITWMLNTPVILALFSLMTFRSKSEDNLAGFGAIILGLQYLCMAPFLHTLIMSRNVPNDVLEAEILIKNGILPPLPLGYDEAGGVMSLTPKAGAAAQKQDTMSLKTAIRLWVLFSFLFVFIAFLLPIAIGLLDPAAIIPELGK